MASSAIFFQKRKRETMDVNQPGSRSRILY